MSAWEKIVQRMKQNWSFVQYRQILLMTSTKLNSFFKNDIEWNEFKTQFRQIWGKFEVQKVFFL